MYIMCLYVCVCVYVRACVRACVRVCVYIYSVCVCIYIYNTHAHTLIYTCMHTCTHTYTLQPQIENLISDFFLFRRKVFRNLVQMLVVFRMQHAGIFADVVVHHHNKLNSVASLCFYSWYTNVI